MANHTLQVSLFVAIALFAFGTLLVFAEEPVCNEDLCDWEAQYCCGNNTCCNWQCKGTTNTSSCNSKTQFCCGNDTCCDYECDGCKSDQFCCGRNPQACCSDGLWHAKWWTWLLVALIAVLFIVSIAFVTRSQLRKPRSETHRGTDPYESGDEKSKFESSLRHQPSGTTPYQSL